MGGETEVVAETGTAAEALTRIPVTRPAVAALTDQERRFAAVQPVKGLVRV